MRSRSIQIYVRHPTLKVCKPQIKRLFCTLDELEGYAIPHGELSIAVLTDAAIADIHNKFMDDPSKTDVITFCGDPSMGFAGEICVSADRARSVSTRKNLDFGRELSLYLIHGWLHLAGYNDLTPEDCRSMRKAERILLQAVEGMIPCFKI